MSNQTTLRGLTTARYSAADLDAAARWYTELLGVSPYLQRPGYIEFRIGDYQHELGIIDKKYLPQLSDGLDADQTENQPHGSFVYWQVDEIDDAYSRLLALGASELEAPRDFGRGFVGASVTDPFGNILGIMDNPHYLEVLREGEQTTS